MFKIKINYKILALSLTFILVLQTSLIAYTVDNEAEKPSYSIGDSWKYDVDDHRLMMTRSLTKTVTEESTIEVSGNTYDCYLIEFEGSGQTSELGLTTKFSVEGEIYLQKSDLAIVKETLKTDEETKFGGETSYSITEFYNSTYDPPLNEFDFPLSDGESWTVNSTKTTTHKVVFDGIEPDPTTETANISRIYNIWMENVTVPAGTFEAFVINYTDSGS